MAFLRYLEHWPEALETAEPWELQGILGGATLIHLRGAKDPPLMVSTLLHGNEHTGFYALQRILQDYKQQALPRSMIVLIGNPEAAAIGKRQLSEGLDLNRIWDTDHPLRREVREHLAAREVFGIVDIHNNTGRNPHYACVSRQDPRFLHLGILFSRILVYFEEPSSTFSVQMSDLAPTIVIECGRSEDGLGLVHATEFLQSLLRLDHLPVTEPSPHDYSLYMMECALKIPAGATVAIGQGNADFSFRQDLDQLNFVPADVPRYIGSRRDESKSLTLLPTSGEIRHDVDVLVYNGLDMYLAPGWTPSMFTLDQEVMISDSLGYLMRSLN